MSFLWCLKWSIIFWHLHSRGTWKGSLNLMIKSSFVSFVLKQSLVTSMSFEYVQNSLFSSSFSWYSKWHPSWGRGASSLLEAEISSLDLGVHLMLSLGLRWPLQRSPLPCGTPQCPTSSQCLRPQWWSHGPFSQNLTQTWRSLFCWCISLQFLLLSVCHIPSPVPSVLATVFGVLSLPLAFNTYTL